MTSKGYKQIRLILLFILNPSMATFKISYHPPRKNSIFIIFFFPSIFWICVASKNDFVTSKGYKQIRLILLFILNPSMATFKIYYHPPRKKFNFFFPPSIINYVASKNDFKTNKNDQKIRLIFLRVWRPFMATINQNLLPFQKN